jgi:hypothetical protein
LLLGPDGGSQFYRILPTAGVIKDGDYILKVHKDMVDELEPEEKMRILGFVMDNAPVNMKAM